MLLRKKVFEESFDINYEEEEIEAHMPGNTLHHTNINDSDIDDSIDLQSLFNNKLVIILVLYAKRSI